MAWEIHNARETQMLPMVIEQNFDFNHTNYLECISEVVPLCSHDMRLRDQNTLADAGHIIQGDSSRCSLGWESGLLT